MACGQKGPPLAPIVYLPRPVSEVIAKRIENEVVLQFAVPTLNTDNTGPADLRRIEVYAHTGPLPAPTDFLKYGTLVASIPIKQPPEPEELEEQRDESKEQESKPQEPVSPEPDVEPAAKADLSTVAPEGAKVDAERPSGPYGIAPAAAPDVAGSTAPLAGTKAPAAAPKQDAQVAAKAEPTMIEQGWTTTVREALTPKHMEIGPMPPTRPVPPPDDAPVVVVEKIETPGTINFEPPPQRFYTIVGVSESRNRRGPFAGPIPVALLEPLSPPENVDVAYTADAISLMWPGQPEDVPMTRPVGVSKAALGLGPGDPAPGAGVAPDPPIAPVEKPEPLPPVDRETDGTIELFADVETEDTKDVFVAVIPPVTPGAKPKPRPALVPQPPAKPRYGYNVYDAGAPVAPIAPVTPVTPINASLLTAPGFADPRVEFGVERCYVVRRVEMVGAVAIESAPSSPTCVTPVDTFPPAPPKSLALISGGSGVSLLWEANTEPDLGGYVVLRGEAPGDKLSPLTKAPITDTSFLDTTARRGRTYVYEVVAVDRSTPPNQSAPSNRVEETVR